MRQDFPGYFDPTEDDIQSLWRDAVIALDSNVLLGLYRMPHDTRESLFGLLKMLRTRLWIPYHVLVEYHRNRLETMRSEFQAAQMIEREFKESIRELKGVLTGKGVQERACWTDISEKMTDLNKSLDELLRIARSESRSYIAPSSKDIVLEFLEDLLPGRCGTRPASQSTVDEKQEQAATRFSVKMGPGYLDTEKAGDMYMFDGLIYDRQYGDYMVWRELLDYSSKNELKSVLLVTSDVKEDWWIETKSISGKRPQPELVMEMRRVGGVDRFWMYTLSDFVKKAAQYLDTKLTQRAITEVRQVESKATRQHTSILNESSPISNDDLLRVMEGRFDTLMNVGEGFAVGRGLRPDGRSACVLAIASHTFFSMGSTLLRNFLRSTLLTASKYGAHHLLEVNVVFPIIPGMRAATLAKSTALSAMINAVPGVSIELNIVYFKNAERSDFEVLA